jgi:hypothetical protein
VGLESEIELFGEEEKERGMVRIIYVHRSSLPLAISAFELD